MERAVRIPVQGDEGWLGFDLQEVLEAVGEHPDLDWYVYDAQFNGDVTAVWPEGVEIEEQTTQRPGLPMSWGEIGRLASTCRQIIDATFTGYDVEGQPVLSLAVIDSSYWIVWSVAPHVTDAVRSRFVNVEDYPEPRPVGLA